MFVERPNKHDVFTRVGDLVGILTRGNEASTAAGGLKELQYSLIVRAGIALRVAVALIRRPVRDSRGGSGSDNDVTSSADGNGDCGHGPTIQYDLFVDVHHGTLAWSMYPDSRNQSGR